MLEALSLVCDPCSGHISIEIDIRMMMVINSHASGFDALACAMHLMEPVWIPLEPLLILMEPTHLEGPWMALLMMWRWPTHLDGAPVADDGSLLDDDAHMIDDY